MDHYFYQNSGTNWTFEMAFNKAHWNINTFSLIFCTHFNERKTSSNVLSEWMFSEWLNFVWNLPCWNLGRRVLVLDHTAPISLCVLHLYEKCIVCPSVYVTYIVYWAFNVRRQQLIVKSADASINQTVCQVKNVLMFTLHTEYYTGANHNTLCHAGISQCYRHDDVILRNVEFGKLSDSKTMC